jgi:hypothetical protein
MATAEYMVTTPPGAYILPLVGFVAVGSIFQAPTEDKDGNPVEYLPSRHFRAMNAEAVGGLMKVQARLREEAKKWDEISKNTAITQARRDAAYQRSIQLAEQADEMKIEGQARSQPEGDGGANRVRTSSRPSIKEARGGPVETEWARGGATCPGHCEARWAPQRKSASTTGRS